MNAHHKTTRIFDKTDKAYNFLIDKEKKRDAFSASELASYAGWKEKSVLTYLSKKWRLYISKDKVNKVYFAKGIRNLTIQEFRQIHSHAVDYTEKSPEIKELIDKSREFALIAVSNYNNPHFKNKTHSFIVNIVIAYTALFHAIFEKTNTEYFYRDKDGNIEIIDEEYKAFELIKCCNVYLNSRQSPVKANLEFLVGLRNKIEHRNMPSVDLYVEGECQAALTNYEDILTKEFGDKYSLGKSLAVSMQLSRTSQKARIKALKELQTKNYKVIKKYIDGYRSELDDAILQSQEYRTTVFLIPKLGNHATSADMSIEFVKQENLTKEELREYEHGIVLIKNKSNPYRYKPGKVTELVKKQIDKFTISIHTRCWKYYGARPQKNDLNYKGKYCG